MKPVKIKRYKKIYSTQRIMSWSFMLLATIVVIGGLGAVGWYAYPLMFDLLSEKEENVGASTVEPQVEGSSTIEVDSVVPENNTSEAVPPTEEKDAVVPTTPVINNDVHGVTIPHSYLTQTSELDAYLTQLKGMGVNTVMVVAKDEHGNLLYRTKLEEGQAYQQLDAFDASTVVQKMEAAGFTTIAVMDCFEDPLFARGNRDAAVTYMNSDITWLDNAPDSGGVPWINPYSEEGKAYLAAIGSELIGSGFDQVLLRSVQFPSGVGQDKATYGNGRTPSISALNDFVSMMETTLKGAVMVEIPGEQTLAENEILYGGNILSLEAQQLVVEIVPSRFPEDVVIGSTTIKTPRAEVTSLISALTQHIGKNSNSGQLYGLLYSISGDLETQIQALDDAFNGYIANDTQGNYTLG